MHTFVFAPLSAAVRLPTLWANRLICILLCCAMFSMLSGCFGKRPTRATGPISTTTAKGTAPRGTKPYTIQGKTYHPLMSAHGYRQEGIASWYGKDFHGKQTANGERYDMYAMTAAHKILPFNTNLRVTNLSNNKSIIVRVNDRGPFVGNRVIDLTRSGAEQLGMLGPGTARVLLESIGTVPGLQDGDLTGRFYVQVGAFSKRPNAEALAVKLRGSGLGARVVFADQVGYWRVQTGPYLSLSQAEKAGNGMRGQYPANFVVAE